MHIDDVELGSKAKEKLTGIVGIVTGKAEYLSGYKAIQIQPPLDKDGNYKSTQWFDFGLMEFDIDVKDMPE